MFRLAKSDEITKIMQITKRAVVKMIEIDLNQWNDTYPTRDIFLTDIKDHSLYVYTEDDIILGFCVINLEVYDAYHQVTWSSNKEFKTIHRFCVDPLYQNNNNGFKMMNQVITHVKNSGISYLKIDTYSKNTSMNALVKKCGFNFLGQMDLKPGQALWNCYDLNIYDITKAKKSDQVNDLIILAANCVFDSYNVSDNLKCSNYLFQNEGCKFSYENTYVIKEQEKVIAMYIIYDSINEKMYAKKEQELLFEKYHKKIEVVSDESIMGSFYLDTLSVSSEYQNKGISKLLFNDMKKRYNKISLLAEIDNLNAIKTYEKQGFKIIKKVEKFGAVLYQMLYDNTKK